VIAAVSAAAGMPTIISGNLVRNGGAEIGGAAPDASHVVRPAGWTTTGSFTAVKYSAGGGFPDAAVSKAIAGGKQFFAGGTPGVVSTASQVVPVPAAFHKAGVKATAALYAALGGFSVQRDQASVTATFLSTTGTKLGAVRVGPVTPGRRGGATKLVAGVKKVPLPAGTTSIRVTITASALSGGYNDGYADNVAVRLSRKA
jgi:hypothetical protein